MRRLVFPCVIAALLLSRSVGAEPPPEDSITVRGKILSDAPHLVEQFGHATSGDRLARWAGPICVAVRGLQAEHEVWVAARITAIAKEAGAEAQFEGCDPNLIVIIAADDLAMREQIARRANVYLNAGASRPVDKAQLSAFTRADDAPAHIFYGTGRSSSLSGGPLVAGYAESTQFGLNNGNGPPVVSGAASRLAPMSDPCFTRVFLVLDGRQVSGRSLQEIAAYAAMVTLAEVHIDEPFTRPATITALFADAKAGLEPSPDLTVWDRSYLKALYGTSSQINLGMQQSFLADRLKAVVRSTGEPPPTQVPASATVQKDPAPDGKP